MTKFQLCFRIIAGGPGGSATLSGLQEPDYPTMDGIGPTGTLLNQRSVMRKVPLPAELVEHFGHMQCNCMIGLFPELERAWLTIDSDIYVWRFSDGRDLAYFDGLADTILSVGLLEPKKGIFRPHITQLLCLTTSVEIVLLGVTFTMTDNEEEMQLLPEPLFSLSTDATHMLCVKGTNSGRVFMGGKDGCLYEFVYKAEDGWFSKKAVKINHSTSTFSFLVPGFINAALSEEDPLVQLELDNSRNILYSRSEKGTIQVFDLGSDGQQLTKVIAISQQTIVKEAARVALNVDKGNFFPIVGIHAINNTESYHLSLVATTASGVRLYFTTTGNNPSDQRPNNLLLQHVRLPPGFAASSPSGRPSKVHMSYYKNGTLLLSSAQNESSDQLWLLSSDSFAFQNLLMEGQSTLTIDGRVWALEEIPHRGQLAKLYSESFSSQNPPSVVVQHAQPARTFVLISAQGTHIVSKLRPVDHLRQLMLEQSGPDGEAVKAFFQLHGEVQASSTALILACAQSLADNQMADWAARAFFKYGGEPKLVFPASSGPRGQPQMYSPAVPFLPNVASTPSPNHMVQHFGNQSMYSNMMAPEMHFSGKHNGLYLYFARLVRPLWHRTLVVPTNTNAPLTASVTAEEVDWIMVQLTDLKTFLERNGQMASAAAASAAAAASGGHDNTQQDAYLRERQSLMFLQQLVNHSLQVLGLWKVVVEHGFEMLAKLLHVEDQNLIKGMYYRDLIISITGKEVCGRFIQSLIAIYLGDNARTDAISSRLREVCPGLYNQDDALSSKAQEILIKARQEQNAREKEKMISEAVNMCQEVASKLNLEVLTSHLVAVHSYVGVLEICLAAAAKRDPQGLALHYYKNGEPNEDQQGMQAYLARTSAYKQVTAMLRQLLSGGAGGGGQHSQNDPNQLGPAEAGGHAEVVFEVAFKSDDELFHVELYQWLLSEKHYERLLSVRSAYLEDFLTRGTSQHPDTLVMFDLLWKYYEKTRNYAAAAKILAKLADRHSTEINLQQRIEYLSRAIICVKSGELCMESHRGGTGQLLHDLEEKMEVARVQLHVLDGLIGLRNHIPEAEGSIAQLNADLIDITQLYSDFAEPYGLWECQLAILHCAGHPDHMLIETMWNNVIDAEMNKLGHTATSQTRITVMSNKIKTMGKLYAASSQKYFPMGK
jgi:nuclear pore complex protein Nup155